jgi:ABC-type nitrate/sulfonate/bicarbonate transport system substrate-binding protein
MIAVRESVIKEHPDVRENLLKVFRASFAYSENHLEEIADKFLEQYPGDRGALIASAGYPKIEFTFTEMERKMTEAQMEMLIATDQLPRRVDLSSAFVI